jgi:hypothetical protein
MTPDHETRRLRALSALLRFYGVVTLVIFGSLLFGFAIQTPLLSDNPRGALNWVIWNGIRCGTEPCYVPPMLFIIHMVWGVFGFEDNLSARIRQEEIPRLVVGITAPDLVGKVEHDDIWRMMREDSLAVAYSDRVCPPLDKRAELVFVRHVVLLILTVRGLALTVTLLGRSTRGASAESLGQPPREGFGPKEPSGVAAGKRDHLLTESCG